MKRASSRLSAFALAAAACAAGGAGTAATAGYYSHAQATAGAAVYAAKCAMCHAQDLSGTEAPPLVGPAFKRSMANTYKTADALYTFVSQQMPLSAPASLPASDYYAVEAYLLSKNGFAEGGAPLSATTAPNLSLATGAAPAAGTASAAPSPASSER